MQLTTTNSTPRLRPKEPKLNHITPGQRHAYENLVDIINQPANVVDALYGMIPDSKNGKVIGTDVARELSPYYNGTMGSQDRRESAILYSLATSSPASCYAQDLFCRTIKKPQKLPGRRRLLMTAGGPASGKTHCLKVLKNKDASYDLVMDQNLGKYTRAVEQIELALEHHWHVKICYVYRPFNLAVQGIIQRSNKKGRWAPMDRIPAAHQAAQASVLKLYQKYHNHPSVQFSFEQNRSTPEDPSRIQEMSIREISPGGTCHLAGGAACMESMKQVVRQALEMARQERQLEPRLLDAMTNGTNPATWGDFCFRDFLLKLPLAGWRNSYVGKSEESIWQSETIRY